MVSWYKNEVKLLYFQNNINLKIAERRIGKSLENENGNMFHGNIKTALKL